MNNKIDVLGIWNDAIRYETKSGASQEWIDEMKQGRDAVAELIEAARNASAILGHAYHTQIRGELEQDAHDAYQRLDAVIARVGGAA